MPWRDWQFYVVTLAALWGAWALLRMFRPAGDLPPDKRASLTIGGKKVKPRSR